MFKRFMGKAETTKFDLVFAVTAAAVAVWKCVDTVRDYKAEQDAKRADA